MKKYYSGLDGLRAIAVAIVLIAHAGSPFPKGGTVGVEIFFVLSGFLITAILSNEYQQTGTISRKNFYFRRLLRLTPALVLTTLLFGILYFLTHREIPFFKMAVALTYTANWVQAIWNTDLGAMAHCWTLATEEQFYLLWPFAIALLERKVSSVRRKALLLFGLALSLASYRFAMVGIYTAPRIYFGLDTHMDSLILGSALCYLLALVQTFPAPRIALLNRVCSTLLVPIAITILLIIMALWKWDNPAMGRYGFALSGMAAAVVIFHLVQSPQSFLNKALSLPIVTYVGKISYGLYLLHYPIYHFITEGMPNSTFLVRVPIKLTLTFLAAIACYHLFEVRFLKMKKRFASHPSPAATSCESKPSSQTP